MPSTLVMTLPKVSPLAADPMMLPSTLPPLEALAEELEDEADDEPVFVPTPPQLVTRSTAIATPTNDFFIFSLF